LYERLGTELRGAAGWFIRSLRVEEHDAGFSAGQQPVPGKVELFRDVPRRVEEERVVEDGAAGNQVVVHGTIGLVPFAACPLFLITGEVAAIPAQGVN